MRAVDGEGLSLSHKSEFTGHRLRPERPGFTLQDCSCHRRVSDGYGYVDYDTCQHSVRGTKWSRQAGLIGRPEWGWNAGAGHCTSGDLATSTLLGRSRPGSQRRHRAVADGDRPLAACRYILSVLPPSTYRVWSVTKLESSEAKKRTAFATSSGLPDSRIPDPRLSRTGQTRRVRRRHRCDCLVGTFGVTTPHRGASCPRTASHG